MISPDSSLPGGEKLSQLLASNTETPNGIVELIFGIPARTSVLNTLRFQCTNTRPVVRCQILSRSPHTFSLPTYYFCVDMNRLSV